MILSLEALRKMALLPIITSLLIAGAVIYLVPQFREVFDGFGIELPLLTRVFVEGYWGMAALPLLTIVGCTCTRTGSKARGVVALWSLSLSWVVLLPVFVWAMYLPVLAMVE